jgi:hypothetical protein
MAFHIPDPLKYEIRYQLERLGYLLERLGIRGRINAPAWAAVGVSLVAVLLLIWLVTWMLRPSQVIPFKQGPKAWFYDLNSGKLFVGASHAIGPVAAPSGPLPDGRPAGVRAHVYSYVLNPKESDLFVGFLERPDPDAGLDRQGSGARGTPQWGQGKAIKRAQDKRWVSATSPEGREILKALTRPNERGQTPIYQVPR